MPHSTKGVARPGRNLANQLGSRANCFHKGYNRCLWMFQHPLFDQGLEFPAGTLVGFAKGTARILGIGRRWHSSSTLRRRCEQESTVVQALPRETVTVR